MHFADRVRIAGGGDSAPVKITGLIQTAQLFERLAAMKIGGGIGRVGGEQSFKFADRAVELAGVDELHRQSIADEGVGRILREQLLQNFDA